MGEDNLKQSPKQSYRRVLTVGTAFALSGTLISFANNQHLPISGLHSQLVRATTSINVGDTSRPRVDAIDVASYQSNMSATNYQTLASNGVKAAIVKLTEGTNYVNNFAPTQIANARAAGMSVSVYHYAHFTSGSVAAAEAQNLISEMNACGLSKNTLIFADMEDKDTQTSTISSYLNIFWNTLNAAGYTNHGVYTYKYYPYRDAVSGTVGQNRTWLAEYPNDPSASDLRNTDYGAWQFSSTAYFSGWNSPVDVSIDYTGLLTNNGNNSATSTATNYGAMIDQSSRNDGLYSQIPVDGKTSFIGLGMAANHNGLNGVVKKEAIINGVTWAYIDCGSQSFWIDKRGLKLSSSITVDVDANAIINQSNRNDGLYSSIPLQNGQSFTGYGMARSYNSRVVHISQYATLGNTTWAKIALNGQSLWIDLNGLTTVNSSIPFSLTNTEMKIDQSTRHDGMYERIPLAAGLSFVGSSMAQQYDNQKVTVLATATVGGTSWSYVSVGGAYAWIDTRGLQKVDSSSSVVTTSGMYLIDQLNRRDGLYTTIPADGNTQFTGFTMASGYDQQLVTASKKVILNNTTWIYVTTLTGQGFWIDAQGLKKVNSNIQLSNVRATAVIDQSKRNDGLYAALPLADGINFVGYRMAKLDDQALVPVIQEVVIDNVTWSLVILGTKQVWIDRNGLQYLDSSTKAVDVSYNAIINQGQRNDGLYSTVPYNNTMSFTGFEMARKYNGTSVQVTRELTRSGVTWARIRLDNQLIWIDKNGLK
jgi:GH25 family lysozyme M1 (1,4-beta-N-acetylmuramidase)